MSPVISEYTRLKQANSKKQEKEKDTPTDDSAASGDSGNFSTTVFNDDSDSFSTTVINSGASDTCNFSSMVITNDTKEQEKEVQSPSYLAAIKANKAANSPTNSSGDIQQVRNEIASLKSELQSFRQEVTNELRSQRNLLEQTLNEIKRELRSHK